MSEQPHVHPVGVAVKRRGSVLVTRRDSRLIWPPCGVPCVRLVRRGRRHRPGPPAGLIRSLMSVVPVRRLSQYGARELFAKIAAAGAGTADQKPGR
jgi:hypothetical protein